MLYKLLGGVFWVLLCFWLVCFFFLLFLKFILLGFFCLLTKSEKHHAVLTCFDRTEFQVKSNSCFQHPLWFPLMFFCLCARSWAVCQDSTSVHLPVHLYPEFDFTWMMWLRRAILEGQPNRLGSSILSCIFPSQACYRCWGEAQWESSLWIGHPLL